MERALAMVGCAVVAGSAQALLPAVVALVKRTAPSWLTTLRRNVTLYAKEHLWLRRGFDFWAVLWASVGEPVYSRGSPLP